MSIRAAKVSRFQAAFQSRSGRMVMVKKSLVVNMDQKANPMPIAMLVQVASQYESSIYVDDDSKRVNAKSIMGMMTLGLANGLKLVVTADGSDEQQAIEGIENYLCS